MQISALRQSEKPFNAETHKEFTAEYMEKYDLLHADYKQHKNIEKLQADVDLMALELDVKYPKMGKITLPADAEGWKTLYHELKAGIQIVCHKDTDELILVVMDADY